MSGGAVAAVDLGATSGRVIVGRVGPDTLDVRQVARFANTPVRAGVGLHWDVLGLYGDALDGLREALRTEPGIASIGVDSWAVDYALLRDGRMLGTPFHYRDERCERGVAAVHARMPHAELFARNGLQFLPFTTLYQLAAEDPALLEIADTALLIPDLIGFWLTGRAVAERTNASTTGLLHGGAWDDDLVDALGVPRGILPPLVSPGERIGMLRPDVAASIGARADLPVTAVGSHDTASAVVAVPMQAEHAAYISCGTWGLVGVEVPQPVLTEAALAANFTNEGGADGRVRLLHNVMGLWVLTETVRGWERAGTAIDLPALLTEAAAIDPAAVPVFDIEDARFLPPGDMPARIDAWCAEHSLRPPRTRAEYARAIVESLARAFTETVDAASRVSGVDVRAIHIVGGGALNELLCQRVADRSGIPVLAGPVEATALGNLLIQARAAGFVTGSLEALRDLVARTHAPRRFTPGA
ncbi:rhamnulokinase [Microbacterium horticulturae]|uniref:Rhamnulokinase n=1 Tax=Microbacterium horticulturae TaxID=3028316 RepID=A0ABY8C050_9MICO|nr:rhamnulokinase family protein [Microbacterium sp. KACC 23027]WEG08233.1 rhamnulokinase [Microbacterium sp. KACC 23027]